MWIKFANLCRKSGRFGLAEKALNSLKDDYRPDVTYAKLKYMWTTGRQQEALDRLVDFASDVSRELNINENEAIDQPLPSGLPDANETTVRNTRLLARCYLKQGEWKIALHPDWTAQTEVVTSVLGSFLLATHFDSQWYKAWHNWALANFNVLPPEAKQLPNDYDIANGNVDDDANVAENLKYVRPAVRGFFYSISLTRSNPFQDILRLLTLWLKFGGVDEVNRIVQEGFQMMKQNIWLDVVPQLISRILQPNPQVSESVLGLLSDLGRTHPQALIFPLSVSAKTSNLARQRAAMSVIDTIRAHSPTVVEHVDLVSTELIRVSAIWIEIWHEGLEEASRAYFSPEHDVDRMIGVLMPLHQKMTKPVTIREASFFNSYGRELEDAKQCLQNYKRTRDQAYISQAWENYYAVFRKITRQIAQLEVLDLQHASPRLLAAKDLDLAIPGTYDPNKPKDFVKIAKFDPILSVINSKQRPRKMKIIGTDGKKYQYLLKGHEDLRQDNLVMQLIDLVNTLLLEDSECFKRHLSIQKYPTIPLSPSAGLCYKCLLTTKP
ncbi:unnamed protein product [Ambrosiozyma monospora]|uniref:Unnamed protein product n=1 Tax=Ambrosiozyma monospora TaxID=43982 RepID=A0ACB5T5K6_AMBMO|nr:unnamed protein product [Ambrosiozyma monospora]